MNKILYSHKSDHWAIPPEIYSCFIEAGFADPCPLYCDFDAFQIKWYGNLFINPPYSCVKKWVDFAINNISCKRSDHIWLLVPARVDTKWFRECVDFGCQVFFLTGRVKFGFAKDFAPFPSCLIHLFSSLTECFWIDQKNLVSFLREKFVL